MAAASAFRQPSSACRTAFSAQHLGLLPDFIRDPTNSTEWFRHLLKRTCSRVTSASSALGVFNDYALYKSTHSLTHSLTHTTDVSSSPQLFELSRSQTDNTPLSADNLLPTRQSQTADSAPSVASCEVTLSARKVVPCVRWPAAGITTHSALAMPRAACALRFSWAATSSNVGVIHKTGST